MQNLETKYGPLVNMLKESLKNLDYMVAVDNIEISENPVILEFKGFPEAELGLVKKDYTEENVNFPGMYFTVGSPLGESLESEPLGGFDEYWDTKKWEVATILQEMIDTLFSENTNNDACSHNLTIDCNHVSDTQFDIEISIIDYLS